MRLLPHDLRPHLLPLVLVAAAWQHLPLATCALHRSMGAILGFTAGLSLSRRLWLYACSGTSRAHARAKKQVMRAPADVGLGRHVSLRHLEWQLAWHLACVAGIARDGRWPATYAWWEPRAPKRSDRAGQHKGGVRMGTAWDLHARCVLTCASRRAAWQGMLLGA